MPSSRPSSRGGIAHRRARGAGLWLRHGGLCRARPASSPAAGEESANTPFPREKTGSVPSGGLRCQPHAAEAPLRPARDTGARSRGDSARYPSEAVPAGGGAESEGVSLREGQGADGARLPQCCPQAAVPLQLAACRARGGEAGAQPAEGAVQARARPRALGCGAASRAVSRAAPGAAPRPVPRAAPQASQGGAALLRHGPQHGVHALRILQARPGQGGGGGRRR